MRGLVFQVLSAKTLSMATWSARKGGRWSCIACMGRHEQQRRARLRSMSETRSCSQWAYEGEVEKWAEETSKGPCMLLNIYAQCIV